MDLQIGNPNAIYWMIVPLLLLVFAIVDEQRRTRMLRRFAERPLLNRLARYRPYYWLIQNLACLGLVFLVLAMMDIRWGKTTREVPQKGIEVMFVLDVSRSMLADDVSPNRLSRAKQQIRDMVEVMAGDRVGLVAFAGTAKQMVPLTNHYDDFLNTLDQVTTDSVAEGGSRLGIALDTASEGFLNKTNGHRTIVVLTDGEDQESDPQGVAKRLAEEKQARVFTIGLGDLRSGAKVPVREEDGGGFVRFEGETVWSKLDGATLQAVADLTGGAYIPAGTKQVNMSDVYHGYVANIAKTEFESVVVSAYTPRYHLFAVPGLICLILEFWLGTARVPVRDSIDHQSIGLESR